MSLIAPVVSYWKPHIALQIITDFRKYPIKAAAGHPSLNIMRTPQGASKYMPEKQHNVGSAKTFSQLGRNTSYNDHPPHI